MKSEILNLLADSGEDNAIKIIFGVIVAVIWIIGGIMSSMKKKSQQEPIPQQDWNHLLRDLTGGQSHPYTPSQPPPLPPPPVQSPTQNVPFVQQSPRPFVQQYRRPVQQRYVLPARQPPRAPKPIQRRQPKQPQRRQVQAPVAIVAPQPETQGGVLTQSSVSMGPLGAATSVQSSTATARTGPPRVTRSQLAKLIIWSEIIAKPLSIREDGPR